MKITQDCDGRFSGKEDSELGSQVFSEDPSDEEKIYFELETVKEDDHDLEIAVERSVSASHSWLCGGMDCSRERAVRKSLWESQV